MAKTRDDILHGRSGDSVDANFPDAPASWSATVAEQTAKEEGIELTEDHWQAIRAVQEYYAKAETPRARELHDAFEEKFHVMGGVKYVYLLFPGGPVAQGCRMAGLEPPAGSIDKSFGSVQ
jgi:tRNA 2-thiouridine synthesizing protein E